MNQLIQQFMDDPKNDELFKAVVNQYISGRSDKDLQQLAEHFECHMSTVHRWANGVARPLPRLRILVVDYIKKHL